MVPPAGAVGVGPVGVRPRTKQQQGRPRPADPRELRPVLRASRHARRPRTCGGRRASPRPPGRKRPPRLTGLAHAARSSRVRSTLGSRPIGVPSSDTARLVRNDAIRGAAPDRRRHRAGRRATADLRVRREPALQRAPRGDAAAVPRRRRDRVSTRDMAERKRDLDEEAQNDRRLGQSEATTVFPSRAAAIFSVRFAMRSPTCCQPFTDGRRPCALRTSRCRSGSTAHRPALSWEIS